MWRGKQQLPLAGRQLEQRQLWPLLATRQSKQRHWRQRQKLQPEHRLENVRRQRHLCACQPQKSKTRWLGWHPEVMPGEAATALTNLPPYTSNAHKLFSKSFYLCFSRITLPDAKHMQLHKILYVNKKNCKNDCRPTIRANK
jgi:hypothetical protein